jgi:hypothetical protein
MHSCLLGPRVVTLTHIIRLCAAMTCASQLGGAILILSFFLHSPCPPPIMPPPHFCTPPPRVQVVDADNTLLQFVVIARPVTALGTLFSRTTLLEISPRYVVVNACVEEVQVQQAGTFRSGPACTPMVSCAVVHDLYNRSQCTSIPAHTKPSFQPLPLSVGHVLRCYVVVQGLCSSPVPPPRVLLLLLLLSLCR